MFSRRKYRCRNGWFCFESTVCLAAVVLFSGWLAASARDDNAKLPETSRSASSLNNLGALFQKADQFAEAETVHREALSFRKQLLGNSHPAVLASRSSVLVTLEKQRKHADAEPLILEANDILQLDPKRSHDEKRAGIKRTRDFYFDWAAAATGTGMIAKATEWSRKLAEFDEAPATAEALQK